MSNIVFSDKLSLGDAIAVAGKYKSKFKASELARPPLPSHPNIKGDLTGDCAFCEDFQI
jgi:hypothetical protein